MIHNAFMQNLLHPREHTMPQANDKYKTSLDTLRDEIDAIDRELVELLLKRSEIVAQVGELKKSEKITGSYIRARREAVMLRNIISKFDGTRFPRAAAAAIWRTIIGASTAMESPLNLSVLTSERDSTPHFLGREYFGNFIPCVLHSDASDVLADIARNPHTIGIVPRTAGSTSPCWWEALAEIKGDDKPLVFAYLPFIRGRHDLTSINPSLAIGRVEINPTGDEHTLFMMRTVKPMPPEAISAEISQMLEELGLSAAWIEHSPSARSALISIAGFLANDGRLSHLAQLTYLGAYATPYSS